MIKIVDICGKKMYTLESAANKLGVSKRTLDDYYYVIKTAQTYGFDFDKYNSQKIGFLRKYVKQCAKKAKDCNNMELGTMDIDLYLNSFTSSEDSESEH